MRWQERYMRSISGQPGWTATVAVRRESMTDRVVAILNVDSPRIGIAPIRLSRRELLALERELAWARSVLEREEARR